MNNRDENSALQTIQTKSNRRANPEALAVVERTEFDLTDAKSNARSEAKEQLPPIAQSLTKSAQNKEAFVKNEKEETNSIIITPKKSISASVKDNDNAGKQSNHNRGHRDKMQTETDSSLDHQLNRGDHKWQKKTTHKNGNQRKEKPQLTIKPTDLSRTMPEGVQFPQAPGQIQLNELLFNDRMVNPDGTQKKADTANILEQNLDNTQGEQNANRRHQKNGKKLGSYLLPRKSSIGVIRPGNPSANINIKATQNFDFQGSQEKKGSGAPFYLRHNSNNA